MDSTKILSIRKMYDARLGEKKKFSNNQIAYEHYISVQTLNKIIDRHGFQSKAERNEKIKYAIRQGKNILDIAARFRLTVSAVRKISRA